MEYCFSGLNVRCNEYIRLYRGRDDTLDKGEFRKGRMPDSVAGRGRRGLLDPLGPADVVSATDRTAVVLEFERRFTS